MNQQLNEFGLPTQTLVKSMNRQNRLHSMETKLEKSLLPPAKKKK